MNLTALALDAGVLVILICCIRSAAKKGFLRTVLQMIAYVVVVIAASYLSRAAAPAVYDRVVEPMLLGEGQQVKQNADLVSLLPRGFLSVEGFSLAQAASPTPAPDTTPGWGWNPEDLPFSEEELNRFGLSREDLKNMDFSHLDMGRLEELVEEYLAQGQADGTEILRELSRAAMRPAMIAAISAIGFAVLFLAGSVLVNILLGALGVINHLPVIGRLNAFLGGVVGALQGALIVWVLALLLSGILQAHPEGVWIFNRDTISDGYLLRYFINPKLLGQFF